jgi:F-type H+-transporting ATPase subunit delta
MNHDADLHPAPSEFEYHADVSAERLARVYAEALLDAADSAGQAQEVIAEMDSLVDDVLRSDRQLGSLFLGGAVGRYARRDAIAKAVTGRCSDVFLKFLLVLNEHERLDLIRAIRVQVHELDDQRQRRVKVHVFTAVPLPAEYGERIVGAVRQRFGLEPVLVPHVDPALLGGLKLRIGDTQLDATVRTRLDNLLNQVLARSSYEIQSRRDTFSTDRGNP